MEIQFNSLDDVQLAMVLAVYNYKETPSGQQLKSAETYLKWIKEQRDKDKQYTPGGKK